MIAVVNFPRWLRRDKAWAIFRTLEEEIREYKNYGELLKDNEEVEIIVSAAKADEEVIRQLTRLRWIFAFTAGVDGYPLQTLKEKGIMLTSSSGVHASNIAEHVLGAMIAFSRNFIQAMANKEAALWQGYPVSELMGKSLLIIGTGKIGQEIARKAKAFDMEVYGARSRDLEETLQYFDALYNIRELADILPGKDYVCLVVPATAQTLHMMGKEQFAAMDQSAVFINVGRGDTVQQAELVEALQEGRIGGAVLDVYEEEPLPKDSPLWHMPNVILTPHIAGLTPFYEQRALGIFKENLERLRRGEELRNLVDLERKY